jgi:DMSO/TMAO reductase YedYZ molybdopterin-dependent catalytic subunit
MADLVRRLDARLRDLLAQGRADGRLDRRDFVRLLGTGLGASLLTACDSQGPEAARRWLATAGRANERLERWLFDPARLDRAHAGTRAAGERLPAYHISREVPVWDPAVRGAWRLVVDGAVRQPLTLSLDDLRAFPLRTQRVNHYCVEGWTAVVEFTGVPVAAIARQAGLTSEAHYVDFRSFDAGYHESWDVESALHPQALIVLAKDGRPLSARYGAPARVHAPVKLGYKNTKYLTQLTFLPARSGGYWSDRGYEWFGGT